MVTSSASMVKAGIGAHGAAVQFDGEARRGNNQTTLKYTSGATFFKVYCAIGQGAGQNRIGYFATCSVRNNKPCQETTVNQGVAIRVTPPRAVIHEANNNATRITRRSPPVWRGIHCDAGVVVDHVLGIVVDSILLNLDRCIFTIHQYTNA